MSAEALLRAAFAAGIAAVHPRRTLAQHLPRREWSGRTYLFALGKAAATMAREALLRLEVHSGLVIAPHQSVLDGLTCHPALRVMTAAHPVPDAASAAAGEAALAFVETIRAGDRLIALVSGGGSALMIAPVPGVTLEEKQAINRALLASGAPIEAMNVLRAALSQVKGGGLLRGIVAGCPVHSIIMSDIPSDAPHLVASGPTIAPPKADIPASELFARYQIALSDRARIALAPDWPDHQRECDTAMICANGEMMLEAVEAYLEDHGFRVRNLGGSLEGDAVALAQDHAKDIHAQTGQQPFAIISGGETSVRLNSRPGNGGRNLTYALALAMALQGQRNVFGLAADTDGLDGNSGFAGALISPGTLDRITAAGLHPETLLAEQHSAAAFDRDAQVRPGPTGVNVNDLRIVLRL